MIRPTVKNKLYNDPLDSCFREEDDFEVWISWDIGPHGEDSAAIFQHAVISPKALARVAGNEVVSGFRYLVMNDFDERKVDAFVEKICAHCAAPTWSECAQKLMRHFIYEYENYQTKAGG